VKRRTSSFGSFPRWFLYIGRWLVSGRSLAVKRSNLNPLISNKTKSNVELLLGSIQIYVTRLLTSDRSPFKPIKVGMRIWQNRRAKWPTWISRVTIKLIRRCHWSRKQKQICYWEFFQLGLDVQWIVNWRWYLDSIFRELLSDELFSSVGRRLGSRCACLNGHSSVLNRYQITCRLKMKRWHFYAEFLFYYETYLSTQRAAVRIWWRVIREPPHKKIPLNLSLTFLKKQIVL
jgi:hypothetical protein